MATLLLPDSVLLDLETSQQGKLLKVGAVRGEQVFLRQGPCGGEQDLRALDGFCDGAGALIGHNISRHDLPVLKQRQPGLRLLHLPVVDTLFLSPLCFPENPYHHLVKDYKLVSASVNDPVADARQAGNLLQDEICSLRGMFQTAPDVFRCLRGLLCQEDEDDSALARGMQWVFQATGVDVLHGSPAETRTAARAILGTLACQTGAAFLPDSTFATEISRWALAYVLCWLRVAGADSVLPPWVRLHHPEVVGLLERLRDVPCDSPECAYCREIHHPETQLKRYFGFDAFRPTPADPRGNSLQRAIVAAGLRNESMLAVLPTGGGKSLCFQLPALVRNHRRGQLTVVISPLQALMKDQVDGLVRRTGMNNAAALNGLLTSPERGEVLRGIRSGRVSILYVSPEQLRSSAFTQAIRSREIGCWVLDEAHCLSKWGHDFRPDYHYAGRFIRALAKAQGGSLPPVACFTATAKREVMEEIAGYFRQETGAELVRYEGGVERDNLQFEVQMVAAPAKMKRINDLLGAHLAPDGPGCAVVFRATRKLAEETAERLARNGWDCACFHAGLAVSAKKEIQDRFLAGQLQGFFIWAMKPA